MIISIFTIDPLSPNNLLAVAIHRGFPNFVLQEICRCPLKKNSQSKILRWWWVTRRQVCSQWQVKWLWDVCRFGNTLFLLTILISLEISTILSENADFAQDNYFTIHRVVFTRFFQYWIFFSFTSSRDEIRLDRKVERIFVMIFKPWK